MNLWKLQSGVDDSRTSALLGDVDETGVFQSGQSIATNNLRTGRTQFAFATVGEKIED